MKFVAPMDTWEIVGGNQPPIRVRARSFDEALKKARLRNPGYCAACEALRGRKYLRNSIKCVEIEEA